MGVHTLYSSSVSPFSARQVVDPHVIYVAGRDLVVTRSRTSMHWTITLELSSTDDSQYCTTSISGNIFRNVLSLICLDMLGSYTLKRSWGYIHIYTHTHACLTWLRLLSGCLAVIFHLGKTLTLYIKSLWNVLKRPKQVSRRQRTAWYLATIDRYQSPWRGEG